MVILGEGCCGYNGCWGVKGYFAGVMGCLVGEQECFFWGGDVLRWDSFRPRSPVSGICE